jgi:HK97 family phage prohead protease
MTDRERRDARHFAGLEVRVEQREDGTKVLRGTGLVFGQESVDLGNFVEVIDPAVRINFAPDLVALFNHNSDVVLGRSPATMKVERTGGGVVYEVEPPDPPAARDVMTLVERGDVRGNSFQFRTKQDRWERLADGREKRTLLEIDVEEMGPVVFPAYPNTDVGLAMRSRDAWLQEERQPSGEPERRRRELELIEVE